MLTPDQNTIPHSRLSHESWLCLRFTHLALNSTGAKFSNDQPVAITYQQQIWQCNQLASDSSVKPGMSINHALMLSPELNLQQRDIKREVKKLQQLSYWAYQFTSLVSHYNDHTLLLEIGKSLKLFKGLNELLNLISNDLSSFKIETRIGIAKTPKAAYVLSFNNPNENTIDGDLSRLKATAISCLDIQPTTLSQLHNCGFKVLADIDNIPYSEIGSRFGKGLLTYLDKLWGRLADPQIGVTPPEIFRDGADFAQPIRNLNWIQQQLDLLLTKLIRFIKERHLICRSFTWYFYHEDNRLLKTLDISLSAEQNSLETFKELTDLKLATIKLDWEFSSIKLSSTQLLPKQLLHNDLFDPLPKQEQFNQLLDKLNNKLGQAALSRFQSKTEHLPELANSQQHAVKETATQPYLATGSESPEQSLKDQPLWLLIKPQRLNSQHQQPLYNGPLNIIHGPDRVSSHWWAKLQSRDYFIARQRSGQLLWVYFDRCERSWFLHGFFA